MIPLMKAHIARYGSTTPKINCDAGMIKLIVASEIMAATASRGQIIFITAFIPCVC
jgi:hypothetical protein